MRKKDLRETDGSADQEHYRAGLTLRDRGAGQGKTPPQESEEHHGNLKAPAGRFLAGRQAALWPIPGNGTGTAAGNSLEYTRTCSVSEREGVHDPVLGAREIHPPHQVPEPGPLPKDGHRRLAG